MASAFQYSLLTIILFALLVKGHADQCELKNLIVWTEKTDRQIQGKQEWLVMFINTCKKCPQQSLLVSCKDFGSVENVDPSIFAPIGNDKCIVNGGRPIAPSGVVGVHYAWDRPFNFETISSEIRCAN